ncbi:MAG TPA: hypothetical protein VJJ52_06335 [Candidatus Nanoarchaeia archaeon]|nr:hypothetical protein [Candidatus Nanoarchaeia archaeon]
MLKQLKFAVMLVLGILYIGRFYDFIYSNGKLLFDFMRNRQHH